MKKFNLDEYLKNPSRKVVTREGGSARIICTDANCDYPVIALITICDEDDKYEITESFTKDGKWLPNEDSDNDLCFDSKKEEGWVNLYESEEKLYPGKEIYSTKKEAADIGKQLGDYITTAKIEWEE